MPYMNAYGNIAKVLNKIKHAATPPRFTHDFLSNTLGLTGGSARPLIPFLKRIGFIGTDGAPTELYKRFRNSNESGYAAATALRRGYASLYEMNENAHELSDTNLKGLLVQATGLEPASGTIRSLIGSFKVLRGFASFEERQVPPDVGETDEPPASPAAQSVVRLPGGLNLGYTINLHLPATSDVTVFDAIFRSLRRHLLKE